MRQTEKKLEVSNLNDHHESEGTRNCLLNNVKPHPTENARMVANTYGGFVNVGFKRQSC